MYLGFYGLSRRPFSITPDPDVLYLGDTHSGALAHLEYGLAEGAGFTLLTGEVGAGKTTLVRRLLKSMGDGFVVAQVFNTNVSPTELLKLVLAEYDVAPGADKAEHLGRLQDFLIGLFAQGQRAVLMVDEAQNLSREALEEMRMLSNLQTETEPLLHILLVGQPELRERIREPGLAQLAQRITVHCHLGPLSLEETRSYVDFRLREAGARHKDIFQPEAVERIHQLAEGLPRALNTLCDACLMTGYVERTARITLDMVESVQAARAEGRTLPRLPELPPEPPVPPRTPAPPRAPALHRNPACVPAPPQAPGPAPALDPLLAFEQAIVEDPFLAPPAAPAAPVMSEEALFSQMAELNKRLANQERSYQADLRALQEQAQAEIAAVLDDLPPAEAPRRRGLLKRILAWCGF
ncbi:MAG: AAA family ATPase [Thermodesulfobacteriota bacterium]